MPRPIRTDSAESTYLGTAPEVADLPCHREAGIVRATFALTDDEREKIAAGAQIELAIWAEPIPPVAITVVHAKEARAATDLRCENCAALYVETRARELGFNCGHCNGGLKYPEPPPASVPA